MAQLNRTQALMAAFGEQGGTVHDICRELVLDASGFLYTDPIEHNSSHKDGWYAYRTNSLEFNTQHTGHWRGNLQFWLGVVDGVQTDLKQGITPTKKFSRNG